MTPNPSIERTVNGLRPSPAAALLLLLVISPAAVGQTRIYRLGILDGGAPPASGKKYQFVRKLEELGFVEGKNLAIEARAANYE
jgi:hypothetical protein